VGVLPEKLAKEKGILVIGLSEATHYATNYTIVVLDITLMRSICTSFLGLSSDYNPVLTTLEDTPTIYFKWRRNLRIGIVLKDI
jgi:hypothetical protein